MASCSACIHYTEPIPIDPLLGVRLVSPKVLELRAKWQQEMSARALLEQQRFEAGGSFDFEPVAYPYCARFSRIEAGSGEPPPVFVLCAAANRDGECTAYAPRTPDD